MKSLKDQILKLKAEGKSHNQVCKILNTSLGNVSYHWNPGTRKKAEEARILFKENRRKHMWEIKMAAGGKCNRCGYNKCLAALHFHHTDPKTKFNKFQDLFTFKDIEIIKTEVKKCELLCANCHAEEHNPSLLTKAGRRFELLSPG